MTIETIQVPSNIPPPARQLANVIRNVLGIPMSHSVWLIENNCVTVNQRPCRKSHLRVEPGDLLQIDRIPMPIAQPTLRKSSASRGSIEFLHDDGDLCVVVKPANLLTVPTQYREGQTLVGRVERRLKDQDVRAKIFCVHRLDRDVSGVLVMAKSLAVAEKLRNQFAQRKPDRQYIAIVAGNVENETGTVRNYLATDANLNRYAVEDPSQGELAITHYSVRQRWHDTTLVEVRLETGRRNQIRIHLADLGHPILGDPRYRRDLATHRAWPYRRIALHAESLGFVHPTTGLPLRFVAQWPQEFRDCQRGVSKRSGPNPSQSPAAERKGSKGSKGSKPGKPGKAGRENQGE
ncbi:MAG: RluA family pseudouridine synthase [Planctomycetota bacterium]|nr:RluA family pseudouridine synthase [Planctomycetota bacterium]